MRTLGRHHDRRESLSISTKRANLTATKTWLNFGNNEKRSQTNVASTPSLGVVLLLL
jgi:hypothetical protein